MKAIDVIDYIGVVPMSIEKPCTYPSKSEIKRWLNQSSVVINGAKPKTEDDVEFPIIELVFFPKSKTRKTSVI